MPLKCMGKEDHKDKKKADAFLHVQTLHNRKNNELFSLDQSHEISDYGATHSYFMNVWSLGTSASPLTAIEVIPVLPECLRSLLTKYKQVKLTRIISVFT